MLKIETFQNTLITIECNCKHCIITKFVYLGGQFMTGVAGGGEECGLLEGIILLGVF